MTILGIVAAIGFFIAVTGMKFTGRSWDPREVDRQMAEKRAKRDKR